MGNNPLKITETALRDAHQSLLATRMRTEDMLPIASKIDEIGFWSSECWGGATFDSAMRFLGEDPWDRLKKLRLELKNTRTQMLLRGQNLLGYKHYPDDIVDKFITLSVKNGMDVFRIFDALNDVRNMEFAMKVASREGAHVQAVISYTISPVHSIQSFIALGRELKERGADSLCIKDMAGLLSPFGAYELVSALKRDLNIHVQVHTHSTSGMGVGTLLKAAEAGVDVVDTAISTLSMSTSQPPTETVVAMLQGHERDTGLNLGALAEIAHYMGSVRKKYAAFEADIAPVDINVLQFQVPGGMLSNLVNQLRESGNEHKYFDVLAEVPRVRKDLGYPPLVTPSSQIVGVQAVFNVIMGERYKVITEEVKQMVRGHYGRPPAPVDPELKKKVLGDGEAIDCRPADLLEPGWEKAKEEIGSLAQCDEDILSYVLFPQVARPFLERKAKGLGGKEELAVAVAVKLIQQLEAKAQSAAQAKQSTGTGNPWKSAGRARLGRGW